ncbi:MAG TPA: hypothetical protein VN830_06745 [Verrucomicrobiae bacterium]|nr:hypothetical protein [Verrucomicrobiae bacterium]
MAARESEQGGGGGLEKLADWQVLQPVLKTQREILQEVLLCAARYDVWMTLEELAHKTRYPEASISAQLRHLRKPQHGGFVVEKRRRLWAETLRPSAHERVWEYQMRYGQWEAAQAKDRRPGLQPRRKGHLANGL